MGPLCIHYRQTMHSAARKQRPCPSPGAMSGHLPAGRPVPRRGVPRDGGGNVAAFSPCLGGGGVGLGQRRRGVHALGNANPYALPSAPMAMNGAMEKWVGAWAPPQEKALRRCLATGDPSAQVRWPRAGPPRHRPHGVGGRGGRPREGPRHPPHGVGGRGGWPREGPRHPPHGVGGRGGWPREGPRHPPHGVGGRGGRPREGPRHPPHGVGGRGGWPREGPRHRPHGVGGRGGWPREGPTRSGGRARGGGGHDVRF